MGFNNSYIAVSTDVISLEKVFRELNSSLEFTETSPEFDHLDDLYNWVSPRSLYLTGKAPFDVKGFFQDTKYAVIIDFSMLFGIEEKNLKILSQRFGETICGITQGTTGFAQFSYYQNGTLLRKITKFEGKVEFIGTPLPVEDEIELNNFYFDELSKMWTSFGLQDFFESIEGRFYGIQYKDPEEIADSQIKKKREKKIIHNWWKFW